MPREDIAIIGVGQTPYRRLHRETTADLVGRAVREALNDAGVTRDQVDVVVTGFAPDGLAGENCPDKSFLAEAGGVGKWSMRVNTGGTTGIAAAYTAMDLLGAGYADVAVVVAVERMAQAKSVPAVFNSIFDPIYERDIGISTLSMCAMRATRMMMRWGYTQELWAQVGARNFSHAVRNPLAQIRVAHTPDDVLASKMLTWPMRQLDACPISEGVCAVVIARESAVPSGHTAAWVSGRSSVTDTYNLGDRFDPGRADLVELLPLQRAAQHAYAAAGVSSGLDSDVVEIHAPFTSAETMAYAPLQFCKAEDGPDLVAEGFGAWGSSTVINPSGGPQAANPVGATALVRLAECALQVRGTAGDRQVQGASLAIASGQGGANQFSTCTVVTSR
ncbi:MAG: thiolase family protein [Nocardioides sp.]|uniref:thiolase family protein n=1 Tax=Nocardioides sp. TaxID=35761 RepID=UPI0039E40B38